MCLLVGGWFFIEVYHRLLQGITSKMTTTCCILSLPKWPLLAVDYHCQNDHHLLYIITAKITITCCRLSLPKWPPLATGFHCQNDHHLLQRITAKMTIAYYNLSLGNLPPCVSTSGRSGLMPIGYKHAVLGCGHRNAILAPFPPTTTSPLLSCMWPLTIVQKVQFHFSSRCYFDREKEKDESPPSVLHRVCVSFSLPFVNRKEAIST